MPLPNSEQAYIPPEKLTGYLLSETHAVGKEKARVFRAHGFTQEEAHMLEQGLLSIARAEEVAEEVVSPHGTKYAVEGTLTTPRGTLISLRTVWITEASDPRPRFVTAYPI